MECVREPPEWFLWVWTQHSGPDIDQFVVNIRLFKVGQEREMGAEERWWKTIHLNLIRTLGHDNHDKNIHNLRSWTGAMISMRVSKEEITSSRNQGLMLHDRQIQPLCGAIQVQNRKRSFQMRHLGERAMSWWIKSYMYIKITLMIVGWLWRIFQFLNLPFEEF